MRWKSEQPGGHSTADNADDADECLRQNEFRAKSSQEATIWKDASIKDLWDLYDSQDLCDLWDLWDRRHRASSIGFGKLSHRD